MLQTFCCAAIIPSASFLEYLSCYCWVYFGLVFFLRTLISSFIMKETQTIPEDIKETL